MSKTTDSAQTKYTGPHSGFQCSADIRIEDWYLNDELEHRDNKVDNACTVDGKFKHEKGFVRAKMIFETPKAENGESYQLSVRNDAMARIQWNQAQLHVEFKGKQLFKEVDFGSHSLANGKIWVNPCYRWESNTDFSKNSLRIGGVFRYNELMWRAQARFNGLLEGEKSNLGSIALDQHGEIIKNEFRLKWFTAFNATKKTLESWNVLGGWQNANYGALLHVNKAGDNGLNCGGYMMYQHANNLKFAGKYTHIDGKVAAEAGKENNAIVGMSYVADKETSIRATADMCLNVQSHVTHKLNNNLSLMFNFNSNLKQFLPSPKAPMNGYMGYPFKFGLVMKVNA